MITLALNNIKKYYGANKIIEDVSFDIHEGEKVGIVGKNGCGKSTVLKLIMGIEDEYSGDIFIKKDCKKGYAEQTPSYNKELKTIDVLNLAFNKQYEILENMKKIEQTIKNYNENELDKVLKKYTDFQQEYEQLGGYEIEEKLSKICVGLNITEEFKNREFDSLSGGEKSIVLLAKVLLESPDMLLLDEPSNHLDFRAIEWLENFLKNYKGAVLIVSHDRYFLEKAVTKIIEIEDMKSKTYLGNYSEYIKQKEVDYMLKLKAYDSQQKKIKAMENSIKDLRDWGLRGDNEKFFKRAENMQKRLDKIEKLDKPKFENNMNINISLGDRSGKDVIRLKNGFKSFGDKIILKNANFHMRYGEKVALIGNNGCGKSTLIKLILSSLNYKNEFDKYILDEGTIEVGGSLKVGYLPQNIIFKNEEMTILECFREDVDIAEGKARDYLAKYLFCGENVFKKVKNISGGERSRLILSKIMFKEINMLILDEPTNHLDIASREVLESTLKEFNGSILFVSHDRYFINNICTKIVELKECKILSYEGDYDYYKEKSCEDIIKINSSTKKANDKPKCSKKEKNKEKINEKKALILENNIKEIEEQIKLIEYEMNSCNDYNRLNYLYELKEKLVLETEDLMEQWIQTK